MELVLAPLQLIIIGPSATLGKLFKMVKYGSTILKINLFIHKIEAIKIPRAQPKAKPTKVS